MLNFSGRAAIVIAILIWQTLSIAADPPESAETISVKLTSADPDVQSDGLGDLIVTHEGLVGCLPALVKLAHGGKLENRLEALVRIADFAHRGRGFGPQLVGLLQDQQAPVRIAAADAMLSVEEKSEPAVATLIAALRADEASSRTRAAEALAKHALVSKNAIPGLLAAIHDAEKDVRVAAADALGEIASPASTEVISALTKLLADTEHEVQGHAASALWNLDEPASSIMPTLIKLVTEYRVNPERDITQDIWGHDAGIELMAKIGPEAETAVPALIAALDSPQTGERLAAADAFAAIGPAAAPAIERLSKSLRETDAHTFVFAHHAWFVSDQAAIALGKIGDAARPTLLTATADKDERVRCLSANQMAAMPVDDETIAALRRLLNDPSLPVRASAAYHLSKLGPRALVAAPQLVPLLNEEGERLYLPGGPGGLYISLADHARKALQNLKPKSADVMPTLIATLRKDQRLELPLRNYLCELGPAAKDIVPALEPLLVPARDPFEKISEHRKSAALVLAHVAPDHPGLLELLEDIFSRTNDVEFFTSGVGTLRAKARASLPTLRRILKAEAKFPDARAIVASAMVKIDDTDSMAILALGEALQDLSPGQYDIPEARETWRKLGRKGVVAEEKLLAGLSFVETEPAEDAYFRNLFEKQRRLRSAQLLNQVGTRQSEVIVALIEICGCDHCGERGEASDTLGSLGEAAAAAVPSLAKMLDDEEGFIVDGDFYGHGGVWHYPGDHARDALSKIGLPALPALRTSLRSDSRAIRRRAAEGLGNIGAPAQVASDDLIRALQDPYREVRTVVARALGELGDSRSDTIAALTSTLADKHLPVRLAAKDALAKIQAKAP